MKEREIQPSERPLAEYYRTSDTKVFQVLVSTGVVAAGLATIIGDEYEYGVPGTAVAFTGIFYHLIMPPLRRARAQRKWNKTHKE